MAHSSRGFLRDGWATRQVVRRKRLSITALAEELGRNRGSVTRDVNKLKSYGLLRLRQEVNPGHGVV